MKKTDIIDDDGNLLPPPDPSSPVAQFIYLIEYGRTRGFVIGPHVQIGDLIVEVRDMRQAAQMARDRQQGTPDLVPGSDFATLLTPSQRGDE